MKKFLIVTMLTLTLISGIANGQDSLNVRKLGQLYAYWDVALEAAVSGNFVYVADNSAGLRIVNVSNPTNPVEIGYYDGPGNAKSVALQGNYAYVACTGNFDGGLYVINVTNPIIPVQVGYFHFAGGINADIAVSGRYAYLVNYNFYVVDISDATNPIQVGYYSFAGHAEGVKISGNYAYVADGSMGLRILDITSPTNPVQIGSCNLPEPAHDVAVQGNYAYIADDWAGLYVVDISNPASPFVVGSVISACRKVVVEGNHAYLTKWTNVLAVVDVTNPSSPVIMGHCYMPDMTYGAAVAGNTVYVTDYTAGLRVVDVSAPSSPMEVGYYSGDWFISGVAAMGNYAYVATNQGGMRVVEVSNPSSPVEVGFYDTPGQAKDIAVAGNYAFVADCNAGLRVINISNPTSPVEAGFYDTPGYAQGVVVSGNYAYVADADSGLREVDISNPASPVEVGYYIPAYDGEVIDVAVMGNYAYLGYATELESSLRVVNVSNPSNPLEVGYCIMSGLPKGVAVVGNYAYVAAYGNGFSVVDVSNPSNPVEVGYYNSLPGYANGVAVVGNYAYVAYGTTGLCVINVTNPANPVLAGLYNTPGNAYGVAVSGNYAYVADLYYFGIYQFTPSGMILDLTTSPISPPITIPASGGSFQYNCNVHVLTTQPQTFSLWNRVRAGTTYYPVFGPVTRTLPGEASPTRVLTQTIAGSISSGTLYFISYIGRYPNTIVDSSFFTITKSAICDGNPWISESSCEGDLFDEFASDKSSPIPNSSFVIRNCYPNPFNPATTIRFTLTEAATVTLEVFDINGCRVGGGLTPTRFDIGSHSVTFDGSNLPSGIYLYRLTAIPSGSGVTPTMVSGKMVLMK
jgi:hypothetical protein